MTILRIQRLVSLFRIPALLTTISSSLIRMPDPVVVEPTPTGNESTDAEEIPSPTDVPSDDPTNSDPGSNNGEKVPNPKNPVGNESSDNSNEGAGNTGNVGIASAAKKKKEK
jgi:hypothetical protein